jgi:hypothetical protein
MTYNSTVHTNVIYFKINSLYRSVLNVFTASRYEIYFVSPINATKIHEFFCGLGLQFLQMDTNKFLSRNIGKMSPSIIFNDTAEYFLF